MRLFLRNISLTIIFFSLFMTFNAQANEIDWGEYAANSVYYNDYGMLSWLRGSSGNWADANGENEGSVAFATANITDTDSTKPVEWEIANLVQLWVNGTYPNQGILLHTTRGNIRFYSREHSNTSQRPVLTVRTTSGTQAFPAVADTYLAPSHNAPLGALPNFRVNAQEFSLLRFNLSELTQGTEIVSATLRLHTYAQFGASTVSVYRCNQSHRVTNPQIQRGLADQYPNDENIINHPDVVFATGFENDPWESEWSDSFESDSATNPVIQDPSEGFSSLSGRALRVFIRQGSTTGMNTYYRFGEEIGEEPEEMYFRYYLRVGRSTREVITGGKVPGFAGTYDRGGWGGGTSNGRNGWSARGHLFETPGNNNPLSGRIVIGSYVYHADQPGIFGEEHTWSRNYGGFLEKEKWYSVEQYVKMNTPGVRDGIIRSWVNGIQAFERVDFRFRDIPDLKIEYLWMNFYHGGKIAAPQDMYFYIDNVVISRSYIGPMKTTDAPLLAPPGNLRIRR